MPTIKIGALRWAASYAYDPNGTSAQRRASNHGQIMQALSLPEWQSRAPAGTDQTASGWLTFPASQTTMDTDIQAAAASHLGYWAFLRYAPIGTTQMERALTLYQASPYKSSLPWCSMEYAEATLGTAGSYASAVSRLVTEMQQSHYLKVLTNRPLLYIYTDGVSILTSTWGSLANFKTCLDAIRTAAQAAGLGNPYIVGLIGADGTTATTLGLDAVSWYITRVPTTRDPSYASLRALSEADWASGASAYSKIVPSLMAGWHRGPRHSRPESWAAAKTSQGALRAYGWRNYSCLNLNVAEPTQSELTAHTQAAIEYINGNPAVCDAKVALFYAWDEYTEGGYLSPTLGNPGGKVGWISSALSAA
jgi:hypothetical protein